jgi:hypothetical protein
MPMTRPEDDASGVDVLLAQMVCFTGKFFQPPLLQRCSSSLQYRPENSGRKKYAVHERERKKKSICEGNEGKGGREKSWRCNSAMLGSEQVVLISTRDCWLR